MWFKSLKNDVTSIISKISNEFAVAIETTKSKIVSELVNIQAIITKLEGKFDIIAEEIKGDIKYEVKNLDDKFMKELAEVKNILKRIEGNQALSVAVVETKENVETSK